MSLTTHTSTTPPRTEAAPASVLHRLWTATSRFRPVLLLDVVLIVIFASTTTGFLTKNNIDNLLTSVSVVWLIAMGMTLVLLSGGFDLSAGAVATVSGIALAKMLSAGLPGAVAIPLTVVVGAAIGGAVNGVLVGRLRLSVFVVTLATMTALTGLSTIWTDTQTLSVNDSAVLSLVVKRIAGQPVTVWLMLLSFLVVLAVQQRTQFGRNVFAVGGNEKAAALSGIRTGRVLIAVYALVGAAAAIGGVIADGRIAGAAPQVDNTLPLQAIAAVLIGGTSLVGGVGGVGGTFFGMLFVGILANGLSLAGVQTAWQQVLTGVILVVAVLGDRLDFLGWVRRRRQSLLPPDILPPPSASPAMPHTEGIV